VCSDNHDQIGNRADGRRLSKTLTTDQLVIAAALILLGPCTPMVFMGEEWGASTPFMFFSAHPEPELAAAVTKGRTEEFQKMEWGDIEAPDPQAMSTFTGSMLNWAEVDTGDHARLRAAYKELLKLRRTWPDLTDPRFDWTSVEHDPNDRWFMVLRGEALAIVVNFGAESVCVPLEGESTTLFGSGELELGLDGEAHVLRMGPWSVALLQLVHAPLPGG
jgi:maltooligosyltrehalose trehalohydrolase